MKKIDHKGFTIIELLIATVTFSVILLIVSGAIIQFSRVYYRGVITSKTQEVARSVVDEVARTAQFSSYLDSVDGVYCLGDRRFRYVLNQVRTETNRVLISDVSLANCNPDISENSDDDRELLADNMQLLDFKVEDKGVNQFDVSVTVAYGTDVNEDGTCPALSLGGQYCAVSTVKSTVTKRL